MAFTARVSSSSVEQRQTLPQAPLKHVTGPVMVLLRLMKDDRPTLLVRLSALPLRPYEEEEDDFSLNVGELGPVLKGFTAPLLVWCRW